MMKETTEKWVFDRVLIPNSSISISHLFYVDDALFIGDQSKKNISNLDVSM